MMRIGRKYSTLPYISFDSLTVGLRAIANNGVLGTITKLWRDEESRVPRNNVEISWDNGNISSNGHTWFDGIRLLCSGCENTKLGAVPREMGPGTIGLCTSCFQVAEEAAKEAELEVVS